MQFRLISANILFVIFLSLPVSAKEVDFRRLNSNDFENLIEICGRSLEDKDKSKPRISYGNKARQGQFPWAVRIAIEGCPCKGGGCTGSIISPYHILTAAHCFGEAKDGVKNFNVSEKYYVVGGTPCIYPDSFSSPKFIDCRSNQYNVPRRLSVSSIIVPKKSLDKTQHNEAEIAIVQLTEPLNINDPDLRPICLPKLEFDLPEKFVYYGFGETEEQSFNQQLHWAEEEIGTLNKQSLDVNGMIQILYKKKTAVADGDSGGGLVANLEGRNHIFGVTSGTLLSCSSLNCTKVGSYFSSVLSKQDFICYYTGICRLGYNTYSDPDYWKNPEPAVYISDGKGNEYLKKDDAVVMKQFCLDREENCDEIKKFGECFSHDFENHLCIATCNPRCNEGSPEGLVLP